MTDDSGGRRRRPRRSIGAVASLTMLAWAPASHSADCSRTSVGRTPLSELGSGRYLEIFEGGLYPGGSDQAPAAHHEEGVARANILEPLSRTGLPSPTGRHVLLSVGMSNTSLEFCSSNGLEPCEAWTFSGLADAHPGVDHDRLAIINGARSSLDTQAWQGAAAPIYQRIVTESLAPANLTEAQVQVAWIKLANALPTRSLPDPESDALDLSRRLAEVVRTLAIRYPNLRIVFLSNRIYAGYSDSPLNPEPFAYETGFAVKRLIAAQIDQIAGNGIDPLLGDLDYRRGVSPWLAWGPDLWADGRTRRADGLDWECSDFVEDGTHPSVAGQTKVAERLLAFMISSPYARPWFSSAPASTVPSSNAAGLGALMLGLFCVARIGRRSARDTRHQPSGSKDH